MSNDLDLHESTPLLKLTRLFYITYSSLTQPFSCMLSTTLVRA